MSFQSLLSSPISDINPELTIGCTDSYARHIEMEIGNAWTGKYTLQNCKAGDECIENRSGWGGGGCKEHEGVM